VRHIGHLPRIIYMMHGQQNVKFYNECHSGLLKNITSMGIDSFTL
jgi:hypothetical protein